MKSKIAALMLATAAVLPTAAQELRSTYFMETSNYRHEMNPALLDAPYMSVPFVLGNLNLGLTGNMGLEKFIYKMQPGWQGYGVEGRQYTTFMHPSVDAGQFLGELSDKNRLQMHFKYQLAGVAWRGFGGVNVIEMNLRSNLGMVLPKTLFEFMKTTGAQEDYTIDDLGIRTENYVELGFGHSRKLDDQWTVGAKVKFLFGLGYADMNVNKLNLHMSDDHWDIDGDVKVSASLMSSTLEYEPADKNYRDPATGALTNRRRIKGIDEFKAGLSGFGMAVDLGATYKLNDHWTFSAALTDFGFIGWSKAYQASSAGTWTFDGFEDFYAGGVEEEGKKLDDQLEDLTDDLEEIFSVYEEEKAQKTDTRMLAATVNLGAEYTLPVYRNLRFGALYTGRFAGKYSHHQGQISATIRPLKWLEYTVNVAAGTAGVTSGMVLDLHAKHFNFFIGTDRFMGKLSKQGIPLKNSNASVSLGMSIPF